MDAGSETRIDAPSSKFQLITTESDAVCFDDPTNGKALNEVPMG
jgi:hypothetical protein